MRIVSFVRFTINRFANINVYVYYCTVRDHLSQLLDSIWPDLTTIQLLYYAIKTHPTVLRFRPHHHPPNTHSTLCLCRHVIFAPSSVNSYGSSLFPGVSDTMFDALNYNGSWDDVRRQLDFVRNHVRYATSIMAEPSLKYAPLSSVH